MNHQPYETWILDDAVLPMERQTELDRHLKECASCAHLQRTWQTARKKLVSVKTVAAPANFTRDWQISLVARKREQEKKQTRTLLIALSSSAAAILIALAFLLLPDFSFISLTVTILSTFVKITEALGNFSSILISLVRTAPAKSIIYSGMFLAAWIGVACFAWGISVWRITTKGVKVK